MSDIFISYSRQDRKLVEQLVTCLAARGWEVWWDRDIPVGKSYRNVIHEGLSTARCVLVAWSATSVESDWVLAEASYGKERGVLVPVSIDGTKPRLDFAQVQTADLNGWSGDVSAPEFVKLVQGIESVLGAPARVTSPADKPTARTHGRRRRPSRVFAGAAVAIFALAAIVWFTPLRSYFLPERSLPESITVGGREMMLIPAGDFRMGAGSAAESSDHPEHVVTLDAFYLDTFEVTAAEFARANLTDPSGEPAGCPDEPDHPACGVSWSAAEVFCTMSGKRLPTEAEWEKAARGTDGRQYPWGQAPIAGDRANYCDASCPSGFDGDLAHNDGYARSAPVRAYADGRSPYGIFNMAGNVSEWTSDWYDPEYYARAPDRNPENGTQANSYGRVVRGGAWDSTPDWLTGYARTWSTPDEPSGYIGLRCALSAEDLTEQ